MTSPTAGFTGSVGGTMAVSATASCPEGSTPEFQYWVKPTGAASWTILGLGPFVSGAWTWTPPAAGGWAVTAVTRAVGAPESYQARAASSIGTITPENRPPVANDDAIATLQDRSGSVNVLANDSDPDGDGLLVTAVTQGAHGAVVVSSGVATYTPAPGFVGDDSFTYTVDDGRGATATAVVIVTVNATDAGCAIAITGPTTATYGETIHLIASAQCGIAAPQIQWMHRINSAYEIVQPFGLSSTLDYTVGRVGTNRFFAIARTLGATPTRMASNFVAVQVADNVPMCTSVKMTSPAPAAVLTAGVPATLSATGTCPAGSVPEYQFAVKPVGASNWTPLPGVTAGSSSWTPPSAGPWAIRAVIRPVGAHVNYQIGSSAVIVTVAP